jgi:hypothetical protein
MLKNFWRVKPYPLGVCTSKSGAKKESGQPVKRVDRSPKSEDLVCLKNAKDTEPKASTSGMCHDVKANNGYDSFFNNSLSSLTASADFSSATFSSAVRVISMISSTPFAPNFTGTPMKRSLNPYSPSR